MTCPRLLIPVASLRILPPRQAHQRVQVRHAYAIRAGDKSMLSTFFRQRLPHHLPGVVDPGSEAGISTQCAEIGHAYAIRAGDKGMASPAAVTDRPTTCPASLIQKRR